MLWFTADPHFGHTSILDYCQRPFGSVEEMDAALITRWNNAVRPQDTIYCLGDFTLAGPPVAARIFNQLQGQIHIVPGGHDHRWLKGGPYYSCSGEPVNILSPLLTRKVILPGSGEPQWLVLCHYAMRVWDRAHYGSWHLYGHSHGNLPRWENSIDVGVDSWDYEPVSLLRLEEYFLGV